MDRANALLVPLMLALSVPAQAEASEALTLWVWHGHHDLRGLHAATQGQVSVAYLARTLRIDRDHTGRDHRTARTAVVVAPRRGPIFLDPETERTAVVRIEVGPRLQPDALDIAQLAIVEAIEPVFREPRVTALQIDFDARASFRPGYARLLSTIRQQLPRGWRLEMTALGSWCAGDPWLTDVPVQRIVPMMFGPGQDQLLAARRRAPLSEPRCRGTVGIREGQSHTGAAHVYVFPRSAWTLRRAVALWARREPSSTRRTRAAVVDALEAAP